MVLVTLTTWSYSRCLKLSQHLVFMDLGSWIVAQLFLHCRYYTNIHSILLNKQKFISIWILPDNEIIEPLPEAVARKYFVKKVFLEISQNSQENACVRASFLIKWQASACNFIKKEALAQVFLWILRNF